MMAVRFANIKTVEMLIRMGARLNTRDRHGQTALHTASFFGHIVYGATLTKLETLVRCGASLKIRDQDGNTPLECALKESTFNRRKDLQCVMKVMGYSAGMM